MYSELKGISFDYSPDLPKFPSLNLLQVAGESIHSFDLEDRVIQEYHERLKTNTALSDAKDERNIERLDNQRLREIRRAPGYSSKPLEPTLTSVQKPSTASLKSNFDFGEFEANYSADPWEFHSIENEMNMLQDVLSSSSNLASSNSSPIKPINAISSIESSNSGYSRKFAQMGFLSSDVDIILEKFGQRSESQIIEYLISFQNLKKLGFATKNIIDSFELYNSTESEKRKKYCTMFRKLSEMGFKYTDIRKVLIEKELDMDLATETLLSSSSN